MQEGADLFSASQSCVLHKHPISSHQLYWQGSCLADSCDTVVNAYREGTDRDPIWFRKLMFDLRIRLSVTYAGAANVPEDWKI